MKLLMSTVLGALVSSAPLMAQDYPAKPVRVLSGFAAGGAADIIGRIVAQRLSDALKQPFVVETRAGAAGIMPPKRWRARLRTATRCWWAP
jgi:tripartite-type tricarboxylate transporter receptor subunit TctC